MTTTAILCVRRQHSRGSSAHLFGGPDTYVTVQLVPEGVAPLKQLNRKVAAKRGIELIYCGEGYWNRQATTRSALGAAIAKAEQILENHEGPSMEGG